MLLFSAFNFDAIVSLEIKPLNSIGCLLILLSDYQMKCQAGYLNLMKFSRTKWYINANPSMVKWLDALQSVE